MLGFSRVAVQGVNNYSASIAGFEAGGSATGSQNMARLIAQTMQQCSKTELCVSGYSQGAKVADNAANRITQALTSINSVLLFGDPDDGEAFGKAPASKLTVRDFSVFEFRICTFLGLRDMSRSLLRHIS